MKNKRPIAGCIALCMLASGCAASQRPLSACEKELQELPGPCFKTKEEALAWAKKQELDGMEEYDTEEYWRIREDRDLDGIPSLWVGNKVNFGATGNESHMVMVQTREGWKKLGHVDGLQGWFEMDDQGIALICYGHGGGGWYGAGCSRLHHGEWQDQGGVCTNTFLGDGGDPAYLGSVVWENWQECRHWAFHPETQKLLDRENAICDAGGECASWALVEGSFGNAIRLVRWQAVAPEKDGMRTFVMEDIRFDGKKYETTGWFFFLASTDLPGEREQELTKGDWLMRRLHVENREKSVISPEIIDDLFSEAGKRDFEKENKEWHWDRSIKKSPVKGPCPELLRRK